MVVQWTWYKRTVACHPRLLKNEHFVLLQRALADGTALSPGVGSLLLYFVKSPILSDLISLPIFLSIYNQKQTWSCCSLSTSYMKSKLGRLYMFPKMKDFLWTPDLLFSMRILSMIYTLLPLSNFWKTVENFWREKSKAVGQCFSIDSRLEHFFISFKDQISFSTRCCGVSFLRILSRLLDGFRPPFSRPAQ